MPVYPREDRVMASFWWTASISILPLRSGPAASSLSALALTRLDRSRQAASRLAYIFASFASSGPTVSMYERRSAGCCRAPAHGATAWPARRFPSGYAKILAASVTRNSGSAADDAEFSGRYDFETAMQAMEQAAELGRLNQRLSKRNFFTACWPKKRSAGSAAAESASLYHKLIIISQ